MKKTTHVPLPRPPIPIEALGTGDEDEDESPTFAVEHELFGVDAESRRQAYSRAPRREDLRMEWDSETHRLSIRSAPINVLMRVQIDPEVRKQWQVAVNNTVYRSQRDWYYEGGIVYSERCACPCWDGMVEDTAPFYSGPERFNRHGVAEIAFNDRPLTGNLIARLDNRLASVAVGETELAPARAKGETRQVMTGMQRLPGGQRLLLVNGVDSFHAFFCIQHKQTGAITSLDFVQWFVRYGFQFPLAPTSAVLEPKRSLSAATYINQHGPGDTNLMCSTGECSEALSYVLRQSYSAKELKWAMKAAGFPAT